VAVAVAVAVAVPVVAVAISDRIVISSRSLLNPAGFFPSQRLGRCFLSARFYGAESPKISYAVLSACNGGD